MNKSLIEEKVPNSSYYDPNLENRLVSLNHFDKTDNKFLVPSSQNSLHHYSDAKVSSSVEFPQLNRTMKSETLYSLKSQKNCSPHSRIMQGVERKIKKALKTHADFENNELNNDTLKFDKSYYTYLILSVLKLIVLFM